MRYEVRRRTDGSGGGRGALRLVAALGVLALTGAGTGCALRDLQDLRPAAPTEVQPVFASDEEALDAAVATYERYLVLEAEIVAAGGAGAERVLEVATDTYGLDLLAGFREMRQTGERVAGAVVLADSRLVEIDAHRTRLRVAMCLDVGELRVEEPGAEGPHARDEQVAVEVAFRSANAARILLDGSKPWSGEPVCG
ncbi:hypothetical protein [Agromyces silvae]|uniref:hypothetical protein n=1 Tax=Agromyces silvae TaxID=3388266 RepID=UPI00280B7CDE|nr:hypothetical protein [Agromyces protaetiae]